MISFSILATIVSIDKLGGLNGEIAQYICNDQAKKLKNCLLYQ